MELNPQASAQRSDAFATELSLQGNSYYLASSYLLVSLWRPGCILLESAKLKASVLCKDTERKAAIFNARHGIREINYLAFLEWWTKKKWVPDENQVPWMYETYPDRRS